MSQTARHGSCLCEGIQFTVKGEPEKVLICYCRDCSKNAGAPYQISAKFPTTSVKIAKGEELLGRFVISKTNSGHEKHKIFCKACGCTLWTIPMSHEGEKYMVRTSLMDEGLQSLNPELEFYTQLRPSYLKACEGTKEFEAMP